VTNLAQMMGSVWQYTLTYRPQANGIVERGKSEILKSVRVLLNWQDTWKRWSHPTVISLTQLAINTRVRGTTQYRLSSPLAPVQDSTSKHRMAWYRKQTHYMNST